jgi:Ca2+-binding RTX toxin-like protein
MAKKPSIITNGNAGGHIDGTSEADIIQGRGGDDEIGGHGGNDKIDGGDGNDHMHGGEGNDKLTGGLGDDFFVFKEYGKADSDVIRDFDVQGTDLVALDHHVFRVFDRHESVGTAFYVGPQALNKQDHLIYDPTSGKLYYDDDGSGGDKQQLIAVFVDKPTLHASDFHIF